MRYLRPLILGAVLLTIGSAAKAQNTLVEVFTNTGCANCIRTDIPLDTYDSTHSNVVIIYVHDNFPSPPDPFYHASQESAYYRTYSFWNFADGGGDPRAYVNGVDAGSTGVWPDWKATIEEANTSLPGSLAFSAVSESGGKVQLTVHCTGTSEDKSVRLNVALVESGIYYDNSSDEFKNPNALAIWNNVFRKMLPAPQGTDPFVLSGAKDVVVTVDTNGTGWKLSNMTAVAFLQDDVSLPTGEADVRGLGVFNFSTLAVTPHPTPSSISLGTPSPNPSSGVASIPVTLSRQAHVKLVLTDLLGREVATVADRSMSAGTENLSFDAHSLVPGLYSARLFVEGAFVASSKVMHVR